MKVDTIQRFVNRFNMKQNKSRRKLWYDSRCYDLIHLWYDSRNHESNQTTWNKRNKGIENDWYESKKFESNQASRKKFATQKEDLYTYGHTWHLRPIWHREEMIARSFNMF